MDNKFTKEQLIESKRYADHVDVLVALLDDGKAYTLAEADEIIEAFMKKEVK